MNHLAARTVLVLCVLCTGSRASAEWLERCRVDAAEANVSFRVAWTTNRTLQLRIARPETAGALFLDATPDGCRAVLEGPDGRRPHGPLSFQPEALPAAVTDPVDLVLKIRSDVWTVYLGDRRVATVKAPFAPPIALCQPRTAMPAGDPAPRVQKTSDMNFRDGFLTSAEDDNPLGAWETVSGTWSLDAAWHGDWEGRARRLEAGQEMVEFSPNFYKLRGEGSPGLIVAGHPFFDTYRLQAAVLLQPGEAGLVFHIEATNRYYAFTLLKEQGGGLETIARLWRECPLSESGLPVRPSGGAEPRNTTRRMVAAVRVRIPPGQWVMPRVETSHDRIRCWIDNTAVIDVRDEPPAGGRFGLYASTNRTAFFFDDVTLSPNRDLFLARGSDLPWFVLHDEGAFLAGAQAVGAQSDEPLRLAPPVSPQARWLAIGSADHTGHVFSATFELPDGRGSIGILAGYAGPDTGHLRFVLEQSGSGEEVRLEELGTGGLRVLERTAFPVGAGGPGSVELLADTTVPGELRLYRGGQLVLVGLTRAAQRGASGLYVGPNTRTVISDCSYRFGRPGIYRSQATSRHRFTSDPFMRQWSSPEGEWWQDKGLAWHKSDFLGRFSLFFPIVPGSELHLGVEEGATNGLYAVCVEGSRVVLRRGREAVATANLPPAERPGPATAAPAPRAGAVMPASGAPIPESVPGCVVNAEDYWLWVAPAVRTGETVAAGGCLIKQRLAEPLRGRRIRASGLGPTALAQTRVTRDNVKDYRFTEAPHDWVVNGGDWRVVNRFECDPRWTHMNGESADNLAALWSKYRFHGDFCVELHAGMRHGWYERCGDLNLTMAADRTTPSRGYTVTCTGWDIDHSQEWTRFFRNGALLARTNEYLVPRYRDGNERINRDPTIPVGRDVHGAWYSIKLRRVGRTVEYYFDHERIFRQEDPHPIGSGLAGLWTFMNSMVVARLQIAAERIVPEPVPFEPCPPDALPSTRAGARQRPWTVEDDVGFAEMSWHADPADHLEYFVVRNSIGSGRMFAAARLDPVPLSEIAGWRFGVKRTSGARFNFYYSVGRRSEAGAYVPEYRLCHRLSGADFEEGPYARQGATPVPGLSATGEVWHAGGGQWTPVEALIRVEPFRRRLAETGLLARVEGLGNLEPSDVLQGLEGNGPGDAYAVKAVEPIPYALPRLDVACDWSPRHADAFVLRSRAPYTDRRLAAAEVRVAGEAVDLAETALNEHEAFLPRVPALSGPAAAVVPVVVDTAAGRFSFALQRGRRLENEPPRLLNLTGITDRFASLESGRAPDWIVMESDRSRLRRGDPVQGVHLEVRNSATATRLLQSLAPNRSLARFPVFQFRYRPSRLARVSLSLSENHQARISEPFGAEVRFGSAFSFEDGWHTWHGVVTDGLGNGPLDMALFLPERVTIGSHHPADQTGRCSRWLLDDLVFGPAVSTAGQLCFAAEFFSFNGVSSVEAAVRTGAEGYDELSVAQREALHWRQVPNGRPATPAVERLPDGMHHLFLRAVDARGLVSTVTDVPFLWDTQPPDVLRFLVRGASPVVNDSVLNVLFSVGDGAPPVLNEMELRWNGTPVTVEPGILSGTMGRHEMDVRLSLNWPYVFRRQLDGLREGEMGRIAIAGIRDGAGNRAPDVALPIPIDRHSDARPPTLLAPRFPTNVLLLASVRGVARAPPQLRVPRNQHVLLVGEPEPCLACRPQGDGPIFDFNLDRREWRPDRFPYLSFRMRIPTMPPAQVRIDMALELASQRRFKIPLLRARRDADALNPPEPVPWRQNVWQPVTLDLCRLLRRALPEARDSDLRIVRLTFQCMETDRGCAFDLQDVFVYRRWDGQGVIVPEAFDASGIAGFAWEESDPEEVAATPAAADWVRIRARDRGGRWSSPFRAPRSLMPRESVALAPGPPAGADGPPVGSP